MERLEEPGDPVASKALQLADQLRQGFWYHNTLSLISDGLTGSRRRRAIDDLVGLVGGHPERLLASIDRLRARRRTGLVRVAIRLLEQALLDVRLHKASGEPEDAG